MFDTLKYEEFQKYKNTKFKILDFIENIEIELSDVSEKTINNKYEMFSLYLTTPKEYLLPQKLYQIKHEELGEGELFVVPIEQTENGFLYQAVFTRLLES